MKTSTPLFLMLIVATFMMNMVSKSNAATLYSTGASDWKWSSTTSWTYNSNGTGTCGCLPTSGDIIIIRASDSISVPTNINVSGNTTTHVYGELNITGFLDLLGSGSVVNIYPGGQLTSNGSSSSKLRIGGTSTAEYSGNDGNISGPWTISNGSSGPNVTLPVELTSFEGIYENGINKISWTTAEENNLTSFELQKSTDGLKFSKVTLIEANYSSSYNYLDKEVSSSTSYYRIRQVDQDGTYSFSSVIKVTTSMNGDFSVSPNPAAGNDFEIHFDASMVGNLVTVQNAIGNQLHAQTIGESLMVSGESIPKMIPGLYFISVSNGVSKTIKKVLIK